MKKLLFSLLIVLFSFSFYSCSDDSKSTAPSTELSYDDISDIPNVFLCTVGATTSPWIYVPTSYSAQITANGLSIVATRISEEGTSTFAMTVPQKVGSGTTTKASITLKKQESTKLFEFKSNTMTATYKVLFYDGSIVYGTFYATAKATDNSELTITNGTFKIPVK